MPTTRSSKKAKEGGEKEEPSQPSNEDGVASKAKTAKKRKSRSDDKGGHPKIKGENKRKKQDQPKMKVVQPPTVAQPPTVLYSGPLPQPPVAVDEENPWAHVKVPPFSAKKLDIERLWSKPMIWPKEGIGPLKSLE